MADFADGEAREFGVQVRTDYSAIDFGTVINVLAGKDGFVVFAVAKFSARV